MSMNTRAHPDPERLAAMAGADPDALSDRELIAHLTDCAACDGQVRELRALRAALAERGLGAVEVLAPEPGGTVD